MSTAERIAERIDAIMKLVDEFGSARLHAQKYPAGKGAQSYVKNVRAEIERSLGLLATPADGGGQGVTPLTEQPLNGRCQADRDGDCGHSQCPQLRDGEPKATGRHCPLDTEDDDA